MAIDKGFPEADFAEYEGFTTIKVTPEGEIKPWSPDEESLNPWVAVEKWLKDNPLYSTLDQGEAYWVGSDDLTRYMPHMLIKQLAFSAKYWRSWLYSSDARRDGSRQEESTANCSRNERREFARWPSRFGQL